MRFSGWDRKSYPYITNLKITTASPDTRSKLITEGQFVTYGITFDVNKADVKAESYGTLTSIAGHGSSNRLNMMIIHNQEFNLVLIPFFSYFLC